jgi:hypothetical protein
VVLDHGAAHHAPRLRPVKRAISRRNPLGKMSHFLRLPAGTTSGPQARKAHRDQKGTNAPRPNTARQTAPRLGRAAAIAKRVYMEL